jgi:hypothetical protein
MVGITTAGYAAYVHTFSTGTRASCLSMDPFSLATGVAGLISLMAQVGSSLADFQHSFRGARESYIRLTSEITAMSNTLSALQAHIDKGVHTRAATLLQEPVHHCRATLTKLRDEFVSDEPMSLRRRLAWAKGEERRVAEFIEQLERYNTLFNLALQIDLS